MSYRYALIGAGRQGTAAAYDLLVRGNAASLLIIDADPQAARRAAARLRELTGRAEIETAAVDVAAAGAGALAERLRGCHAAVSGVPYFLNLRVTEAALAAGTCVCDFGGNTDLVRQQLGLHDRAAAAGVSIVPDCGLEPGLFSSLLVYGMELLDHTDAVHSWCGGLPLTPQPPWNYALYFHMDGLLNEYWGTATFLAGGEPAEVPAFSGYEQLEVPGLGRLEAFVTSGGTSTCPETFRGRLRTLESRTLRYPGHYEQMRLLHAAGFFSPDPVTVQGAPVVPRRLTAQLLEGQLRARPGDPDIAVLYLRLRGQKGGQAATAEVLLRDQYEPATGFTAMERTTGWHAAMVAALQAAGAVAPGARPVELAVPGAAIADGVRARGMDLSVTVA